MEHNAESICRTILSDEEQKMNTQIVEEMVSIFLILYAHILFQCLENRFHNSILFQCFQYRVGTLT